MGKISYLLCIGLALIGAVWAIEAVPDYGPVAYEFTWSVSDPHTGDIKSQKEQRKDDKVVGQYTIIDSDGYLRTVDYTADDHNGFNAIVQRQPTNIKIPQPEPKKLIATKLVSPVLPLAPLVHYARPSLKGPEPSLGNYVSVSRPTAQYKY